MAASEKRSFPADDQVTNLPKQDDPSTSSEILLQHLLNAIQTTNDIIGECNNNNTQQNTDDDQDHVPSEGSIQKPLGGSTSLYLYASSEDEDVIPPPGLFSDEHLARLGLLPLGSKFMGKDSVLLLPPPAGLELDSGNGVKQEDTSDENVIFPPPPVFDGITENSTGATTSLKKVAGVTTDSGDRSSGLPSVVQVMKKIDEEMKGKIVGGMFTVREVCALIENDQMHVLQNAVDVESAGKQKMEQEDSAMLPHAEKKCEDLGVVGEHERDDDLTLNVGNSETETGDEKEVTSLDEKIMGLEVKTCQSEVNKFLDNHVNNGNSLLPVTSAELIALLRDNLQPVGVGPDEVMPQAATAPVNTNEITAVCTHMPTSLDPDKTLTDPDKTSPDQSALLEPIRLNYNGAESGLSVCSAEPLPNAGVKNLKSGVDLAVGGTGSSSSVGSNGNLKPEAVVKTQLWQDTAVSSQRNVDAEFSTDLEAVKTKEGNVETTGKVNDSKTGLTGFQSKSKEESNRKVGSGEKCKVEIVQVDVSKTLQETENERHYFSKTVKTTVTQETRAGAVGMATDFGARSKVSSFGVGNKLKLEQSDVLKKDAVMESNNEIGIVHKQEVEEKGNLSGKEKSGKVVSGEKSPSVKDEGKKENSVFDTLLDENDKQKGRKSWPFFEQRDATRQHTTRLSTDGNTVTVSGDATKSPVKTETQNNVTAAPSSNIQMTDRSEEIVRLPRPVCLNLPFGKPPSNLKQSPSAAVQSDSFTIAPNSSVFAAPLATPEESLDDTSYTNRSRRSSVGPCRSRQSSVGHARSRQSSMSSLLGLQVPPAGPSMHFVVVAIDFGTTYSGYAFSFTRDPDSIHMMRRWEGGDPGIVNQKTPTTLLLTPDGKFHSFGFTARDFYHDLDPQEAKKWLYFEKFKMTLHHNADLNKETTIKASNGKSYPALSVFSHALTFFKDHALRELSDQSSTTILNDDIRWVLTVPAIWKAPAKQFMRQAAYQAGIASSDNPNQLLIALEPEAASIYVRKLRLYQLMPDPIISQLTKREPTPEPSLNRDHNDDDDEFASSDSVKYKTLPTSISSRFSLSPTSTTASVGQEVDIEGTNYMVVDCGGGTVDITVYEMESGCGRLKELHKATGGPYGSLGIDYEFEKLLIGIFGNDFIEAFRLKRPAGWVDLMIAFESRKRAASPVKNNPFNVSLPFSFIDYYKKYKGSQVESAIRKNGNKEISWSSQGMLRLTTVAMRRLFQPTLDHIKQAIGDVLNNPNARDIKYMFLVGGFAESAILQMEMRKEFDHILKILIPQDVGLTILKGAVCFGLDPMIVSVRRCRMTYGVGVLNRFIPDKHPRAKMITKEGAQWCTDVFDKFVEVDQSVAVGETVVRSYTPAKAGQKSTIIHVYCSEKPNIQYITDAGVKRCGTLCLDLTDIQYRHSQKPRRREIQARMTFGDTEIKVMALDVATGKYVRAAIDFMSK